MNTQATACLHCGDEIAQPRTGRPRKYCSSACRTMAYDRRQLNIDATLVDLHAECDGICYLCETPIDLTVTGPLGPSIDHVQATYRGGNNERSNLALTHLRCNIVKSGRYACPHCSAPI
jgi:hypothetical protein